MGGCHSHGPYHMPMSLLREGCLHGAEVILDCPDCVTSRERGRFPGMQVQDLLLVLIYLVLADCIRELAQGIQGPSAGLVSFDTIITQEGKGPFLCLSLSFLVWKRYYFGAAQINGT